MSNELGINVRTSIKALLIIKLSMLPSTIQVQDGDVYHEDPLFSQVHVQTNKTEEQMEDWLMNCSGEVEWCGVFERG